MIRTTLAYVLVVGALGSLALSGCDGALDEEGPQSPEDLERVAQAALGAGSNDTGWYYQLKSVSNGLCADVEGRSEADGARILQFGCGSGPNQRFYFRALSSSTYQLSAQHSVKCIRVEGGSSTDGAPIVQDGCARSGTDQIGTVFTLKAVGTATPTQYQLVATNSGKCIRSPNATGGSGLVLGTCATGSSFLWTTARVAAVAASDANGRWSGVINTGNVVPISGALLPNRKVLLFASWKGTSFAGEGSLDQTVTVLFDPSNNSSVVRTITNTAHNMFCPGTAMMADGRLLVSGGDDAHTNANSIYDPVANSWTRGAVMRERRWYNTSVTLADGRVLTLGGNRTTGGTGDGEIYNPATNSWTFMSGIDLAPMTAGASADSRAMEHPRLLLAPDGRVFAPGPTPNMQFYSTSGGGSVTSAGRRGDDEFSQNDITVMYDVGKLLKAGGNPNYDRTNARYVPSSHNSYLIDFNGGTASVAKVPPMKYPRNFGNGVVLPNGTVFVAGGLDNAKGFSDDGKILAAEVFDPRNRTWKELPPAAVARPYHSIALLLADGRVLVGGGGLCSGNDNCAVNHPNVEIYSPPYLYAGTRPTVSAPSTVAANGGSFNVTVSGTVTRFTLVRMASVTHSVNTDQRLIPLASSGTGGTRTLIAPANRNIAPPGYYLLFALNGDVPSIAAIVKIT